jgi:pimeloyl-ACP methyl ester carboxylesterase
VHLLMVSAKDAGAFEFFEVPPHGEPHSISRAHFLMLAGCAPLVMAHGYRETSESALDHFHGVVAAFTKEPNARHTSAILFKWNSGPRTLLLLQNIRNYRLCQQKSAVVGKTLFRNFLVWLDASTPTRPHITLYGHSLGCHVILSGIAETRIPYTRIILAGAACSPSLLVRRSNVWGILRSPKKDLVLRFLYPLFNWFRPALGIVGAGRFWAATVVTSICDCSHGGYHRDPAFYELLRETYRG